MDLKFFLFIYALFRSVFCVVKKCCEHDEQLEYCNEGFVKNENDYQLKYYDGGSTTICKFQCIKKRTKRVEITNRIDVLNGSGTCYDVLSSESYVQMKINNKKVVHDERLSLSNYFSKCCPFNYVYNQQRHACDFNKKYSIKISEDFIKIGLPNCRVIQDLNFTTFELLNANVSEVKSNNISYCTDRSTNGNYILRTCQNSTDICKDKKCVRKCCKDGKSFVNGRCSDDFKSGLNMLYSKRVIQPKGIIIIFFMIIIIL